MKLSSSAVEWAIRSLLAQSDTDLFPRPLEFAVLADLLPGSAQKLADIDLSTHNPLAPRRFIVPKDDLSIRAATQFDPLDSVFLTALMYEYGHMIEKRRRPASENTIFSYRFGPSPVGDLYASRNAWNEFWARCLSESAAFTHFLVLDIADFYNQIYHHTLENQLIESGLPNQATRYVLRLLETVSAKVSRGVPVGPHAAHLLAEASLIPVDNSLAARGFRFVRFVDDIIVFASGELSARTTLYQVAEVLDKQQRLQLQKGKTRILDRATFRAYCEGMIEDRPINDLEKQLVSIVAKYSKGDPYRLVFISDLTEEDLRAFQPAVIEQILADYLAQPAPDFVRLRWFLRRLAQVGHPAAISYCLTHFERLVPAISEMCRYFVATGRGGATVDWRAVGAELITLLDNGLVLSNEYFQLSLHSLFALEPQLDHLPFLIQRYKASSPYIRRKIILAAARANVADWLRELKEDAMAMDPWTKRAFLIAARSLPMEERRFFLRFASADSLMEQLIVDWAKA